MALCVLFGVFPQVLQYFRAQIWKFCLENVAFFGRSLPILAPKQKSRFVLCGNFGPEKKNNLAPPTPKFPANTLPAPRPPSPTHSGDPPPPGIFNKESPPPPPPAPRTPLPLPRAEKKLKISEMSTKVMYFEHTIVRCCLLSTWPRMAINQGQKPKKDQIGPFLWGHRVGVPGIVLMHPLAKLRSLNQLQAILELGLRLPGRS